MEYKLANQASIRIANCFSRNAVLKVSGAVFFVLCGPLLAIGQDLELPPPPADTTDASQTQDLNQLKAQVAQMQGQINDLNEAVRNLTIAMNDQRALMIVIAKANSFDEARRLAKEKLGIAEVDQVSDDTYVNNYLNRYSYNRKALQDQIKTLKVHKKLPPKKINRIPVR